jgi:hypothetical protein
MVLVGSAYACGEQVEGAAALEVMRMHLVRRQVHGQVEGFATQSVSECVCLA